MRYVCLILVMAAAGCESRVSDDSVGLAQVLAGPYALRLSVAPTIAHPGERVTVTAEFENTGAADLWAPRQRELFLGYRQDGTSGESWSSSCDGIRFVRVHPGEKLKYDQAFEVPSARGAIEIFTTVRRDITVPLVVEPWPFPVAPRS